MQVERVGLGIPTPTTPPFQSYNRPLLTIAPTTTMFQSSEEQPVLLIRRTKPISHTIQNSQLVLSRTEDVPFDSGSGFTNRRRWRTLA